MTDRQKPDETKAPRRASVRGQAFTLEGFIASIVILSAVLFALQAIVATPTSGGQLDPEVQQDLKNQARDILAASANNGSEDLSFLVRLFGNQTGGTATTWERAQNGQTGYGSEEPFFHRDTLIGNALNETFSQRGFSYNLIVEYLSATDANETETSNIVFRGSPTEESVTVSYTIVLYDNQTLTGTPNSTADCTDRTIESIYRNGEDWNASDDLDCYFPVPEAELFDDDNNENQSSTTDCEPSEGNTIAECEYGETNDSPIYNIIEIRVVVWG